MEVYTKVEDLAWSLHPLFEGVQIRSLVTRKDDGLNVSCLLVKVPVGVAIPEHVHAEQVDILYPLSGNAEMHVEGTGKFQLAPGVVVRVPIGVKHKIFNVTKELVIYDVFHPATL